MVAIEPISIWDAGVTKVGTILNVFYGNDNINNSCTFSYTILNEIKQSVFNGAITMSGEAYALFDSNEYAYNWVAEQLNITIIGPYVDPTPTPTPTPTVTRTPMPTPTETPSPSSTPSATPEV